MISRINYLKEKFLYTANDGKKNLYIFKYLITVNDSTDRLVEKINKLFETLKEIVRNDFDLLIIVDNIGFNKVSNRTFNKNIYIKKVGFFAPERAVIGTIADKQGWGKIFNEFQPNFKLPKTKTFKFESTLNEFQPNFKLLKINTIESIPRVIKRFYYCFDLFL